jgi:rare lipoprotein A
MKNTKTFVIGALLCLALFSIQGCSSKFASLTRRTGKEYEIKGLKYIPLKEAPKGTFQQGLASWYGPGFHGKKTASGEIFDMGALTAAHKTLPLGSIIHVINMENKKEAVLRINDRGPFSGSRILDVSKSAAQKLGMIKNGVAKVRFNVIGFSDKKRLGADKTLIASKEVEQIQGNPFKK